MGICPEELISHVIRPTLEHLGAWSQSAENLMIGTAVQESGAGFHLKQKRHKGIGIFQITPQQHKDVWDNYLAKTPDLASTVRGIASQHDFLVNPDAELATNLAYSTAIAWFIYQQQGAELPLSDDVKGLAKCWYRHFHRRPNGSLKEFEKQYRKTFLKDKEMAA